MRGEGLSKAYEIADWGDNPWSERGRKRYEEALKTFRALMRHDWLKALPHNVRVLDVGAGRGLGGVALAKVLREGGRGVELLMIDLREGALRDAERFASEEGVEAEVMVHDALRAHELGRFDVILMYGAILAHFDEWSFIRLLSSAAEALRGEGVVIIEELDRVDHVFRVGFRDMLMERRDPRNPSLSYHLRYDPIRGTYTRVLLRLKDMEAVEIGVNFRSIAHIASVLWTFVSDVDIISKGEGFYLVLGRGPRRGPSPAELARDPRALGDKHFRL